MLSFFLSVYNCTWTSKRRQHVFNEVVMTLFFSHEMRLVAFNTKFRQVDALYYLHMY